MSRWRELHERMEKYYKGHLCWLKDQGHYHPHDDKDRLIHCAFPQCIIHSETCIKGTVLSEHPVLSGHWSIPRRCPLKTGYTVFIHLGDWAPCNLPTFFLGSLLSYSRRVGRLETLVMRLLTSCAFCTW